MPINLGKIFSGSAEGILKGASDILDKVISNKEELIQAKTELEKVVREHEAKMQELVVQQEKNILDDIANARSMQMTALGQEDKFSKRFTYYLAAGIIFCVMVFDFSLFIIEFPNDNRDMLNQVSGILNSTALVTVVSFFFGSTKSSQDKTQTIKTLSDKMVDGNAV